MPVKKREPFAFRFKYKGEEYYFATSVLYKGDEYICDVDLTATEYYGNKTITLICCQIAIEAHHSGVQNGEEEFKQKFREWLLL